MIYNNKLFKTLLVGLVFAGGINEATARSIIKNSPTNVSDNTDALAFIENKGQWEREAKFKTNVHGYGAMFVTDNGFVYNYAKASDIEATTHAYCVEGEEHFHDKNPKIKYHAYKVNFVGSNPNVAYTTFNKAAHYTNYFIGSDKSKWASKVGTYGKVKQSNIYDGIDVVLYASESSNLKYDFVVAPGKNPSAIQLSFSGVKPQLDDAGNLKIVTSVNEVLEKAPYSYQLIDGKEVEIASRYTLKNGVLSFEFPNGYNNAYELVIDPELVFATYSGSRAGASSMYSHTTTYDAAGSLYAGAECYSIGWPTTLGAYDQVYHGGHDIGINKYNSLGTALVYSTYVGGNALDYPVTLRVNHSNELVIGGYTRSSDFPVSAGAFQNALQGGYDMTLSRLSLDGGQLMASTYIGTTDNEFGTFTMGSTNLGWGLNGHETSCGFEINFDRNDNVWLVSNTSSASWPTTSNASQLTLSGNTDGVIMKFNPSLNTLMYSSYLGGSGDEVVYGIELTTQGNPVVVGATSSQNFPTTNSVYQQAFPGGNMNGFITIFDDISGQILISTYLGTTDYEHVTHVQVDAGDNIYVLGRTTSNAFPITANAFTNNLNHNNKLFVSKFSPNLQDLLLSTVIKASGNIFPSAFVVDICGNAYIASLDAGADMPLTADAFGTARDDFWMGALDRTFRELIFGSYFGDPAVDDHNHMGVNRLDPQGIVYHSVCASSSRWPVAPANVFGNAKQNSGQDIISFKFNFDKTGVQATFDPDRQLNPIDSGCIPYTVVFQNTSQQAQSFYWDFGDGNTSTAQNPTHTYTTAGVFDVMMVAVNDSTCITHDTAWLNVTAYDIATPQLIVKDTNLCALEDAIDISVLITNPSVNIPGNVISWSPMAGIIGANNTQTVTVNPNQGLSYRVRVADSVAGVCSRVSFATVNINLMPRILDIITADSSVCEGALLNMKAIGSPGYTYNWSPALGVSDTTQLEPTISALESKIYTLTASSPHCIDTSVMFYLDVHEYPKLQLAVPSAVCEKTEVQMTTSVAPYRNDYSYVWTPTTGLSIGNGPNTTLIADTTRHYQVKVATPAGCADSVLTLLTVHQKGNSDAISGADYCAPGSAQLWATNGKQYLWEPSIGLDDPTKANPITSVTTNTNYTVYVTDENDCIDTLQVLVEVHPRAILGLPDTVTVYAGQGYQVASNTNALHFDWFPPSGVSNPKTSDPYLSPSVRTKYYVTAKTEFGCETVQTVDVLVGNPEMDMPNAYAPNNEGAKLFKPVVRGNYTLKTFAIFNRWGAKVYESQNINDGWDGTFKGVAQPFGVYVYVIDAISDNGQVYTQTGNVTLLR